MLPVIQTIKRVLAVLFLLSGITVLATGVYCYQYRNQIIQKLLEKANQQLSHPIQMSSLQFTALRSFPSIAVVCNDVVVKDRLEGVKDVVAVRKIYCVFDVWKFIRGQYVLSHLYLEGGKLHVRGDSRWPLGCEQGVREEKPKEGSWITRIQKIHLRDVEITYGGQQQYGRISSEQVQASLSWGHTVLEADIRGRATIRNIQTKNVPIVQNLPLSLWAKLSYDQQKKTWTVQSAQLRHSNALLDVQGNWGLADTSSVYLKIQGKKISPQLLMRCFSQEYYQKSKLYDLRGGIFFSLDVRKQPHKLLTLRGDFLLRDGAVAISQSSTPIELPRLSGHLSIPNVQDLETAVLNIDQLAGRFANSKLEGDLIVSNFSDPHLQCTAEAVLDLASLSTSFDHVSIEETSGELGVHGELKANLQQLMRGIYTKDALHFSGVLQTQATQFKLVPSQVLCKDLRGKLVFKNDVLYMQDLSGSVGPGSFALSGTAQNLLPYLFSDSQKLCIGAQLYVDYLDLDSFRYEGHMLTSTTGANTLRLDVAPHWVLDLDCDIQQLHYSRFQGSNVRGKVKIKDQKLIAEKLQLGVAGGKVLLDGSIDTSTDDLNIHTVAQLQGVGISDLFYTFDNFRQTFLIDSHLRGKIFSDVDLTMQIDKKGNMHWNALYADIDFRIIDGELHDFEPLRQLARYIDQEHLANLRFSELKNHIHIKNQTIYIPPMEVHADPTHIRLSGTHTFGGKINYSFCVPLMSLQQKKREIVSEKAAETVGPYLLFKLHGDTDHYTIDHDVEASRKSIAKAIRSQGKEVLRALIQGESTRNKRLQELSIDDYFDFDE